MRSRYTRSALPLAASLGALFSCSSGDTSTQIVVVVDSDLRAGTELSQVEIALYEPSGAGSAIGAHSFEIGTASGGAGTFSLPLSFALSAPDEDSTRPFRLVVTGSGQYAGVSGKLVETALTTAFKPKRALRLDVFLAASCATEFCSSDADGVQSSTCVDGACVPVPDRTDLPTLEGGPLGGYDSPVLPIGEDGSVPTLDGGGGDSAAPLDASGDDDAALDGGVDTDGAPPIDLDGGDVDAAIDAGMCPPTGCVCAPGSVASGDMCVDIEECAEPANTSYCASTGYACEETAAPGYTCRGHRADWRMPDSVVGAAARPSYTPNNSGGFATLLDNITGLEWATNVEATMGGQNRMNLTYAQGEAACAAHGAGWRIPSLIELLSILDTTRALAGSVGVMLDPQFQATNGSYWSSTLDPATPTAHRLVSFSEGTAPTAAALQPASARVRCVRSPSPVASGTPQARYTPLTNNAGAVIGQRDLRTGLYWSLAASAAPGTYAQATAYCAALGQELGLATVRLPTYKELLTLVTFGGAAPYIDAPFAPNTSGTFWSATGAFGDTARGYTVNFTTGTGALEALTNAASARCVASSI